MGLSINDVANWEGGKGKKLVKITDGYSTEKLLTWGRGVSKLRKNGRRCLWMLLMLILSFWNCLGLGSRKKNYPTYFILLIWMETLGA